MRTIGLIGGMSWVSTIAYYRLINEMVAERIGNGHSAKIIVNSVDFHDIVAFQKQGAWSEAGVTLANAGQSLEAAGADFLLIGAVTMHKVAPAVQDAVQIPLLSIMDVTAEAIRSNQLGKVGLLGTKYTMEDSFFTHRLLEYGIDAITPDEDGRETVHRIIFEELSKGILNQESGRQLQDLMTSMAKLGAEGIILGCTELSLLVKQGDVKLPLFDTTSLHVQAAVQTAFM